MVRYVASWPEGNGKRGKASFSVALYGNERPVDLQVLPGVRVCESVRQPPLGARYSA